MNDTPRTVSTVKVVFLSLVLDGGVVRTFDLHQLTKLEILDAALRRDLDYYLKTQLSAKKKEVRTFHFFAQGQGTRTIRLSYTLEAPVWKATYRILLGEENKEPLIQGWAVVDNTQDEDWENVQLSLIAGLPVSFVHDLYTPRYIRRPVVAVKETTGVLPPEVEEGLESVDSFDADFINKAILASSPSPAGMAMKRFRKAAPVAAGGAGRGGAVSSTPAQVRERKIGDLFEYQIEHPVTIRRNQSALVPIVLKSFSGRPVLLHNNDTRPENPMRCVEFKNTTGLTLEGGPVTVLEGGSYVGEAMLDTLKPDEERLVPFAVELSVRVHDHVDSHQDRVHKIVIRKGVFTTNYAEVRKTTYHFDSKSDVEHTIYLDHARQGKEWKLIDSPEPHETTENYWRFKFVLPARQVTRFTIQQRHLLRQTHSLAEMSDHHLGIWLEQRYLDTATEKTLREVIRQRLQAAGFEEKIKQLEKEREAIHAEQKRIRDNLKALGERSSEKDLRERFVRTLNTQEDRLEQIERDIQSETKARDAVRAQILTLLNDLEYEATP